MASPTWWTWVWVNSGSWWWTRRPGMLQSMGLQSEHDGMTELNWITILWWFLPYIDMNPPRLDMWPPASNPPPTTLPVPFLWVVPVHQLWLPYFMPQTWTGQSISHMLIYIFQLYSFKSPTLMAGRFFTTEPPGKPIPFTDINSNKFNLFIALLWNIRNYLCAFW